MRMKIVLLLALLIFSTGIGLSKEPNWLIKRKQVKLLSHTREDVIKILGNPIDNKMDSYIWEYDFAEGRMSIRFEDRGLCIKQLGDDIKRSYGWKVPEWTVTEVDFSPEKPISRKKSFITFVGFTKKPVKYDSKSGATPDDYKREPFLFEYYNDELGIYYLEYFGKIAGITFYPSKQFNNLKCEN